jgi:hypothetical protein
LRQRVAGWHSTNSCSTLLLAMIDERTKTNFSPKLHIITKPSLPLKKSKKPLPRVEVVSYGRYTQWDRESRLLPELVELTHEVTAKVGVEFGMMVEIFQAKGRFLDFRIDHPPFKNDQGNQAPPFEGSYQIKTNPYVFFLGDTIWEPVADKRGAWTMTVLMDGQTLATTTILLK